MMTGRRKLWLIAPALALGLAALGLTALAAARGQTSVQAETPPAAACSSCDARHQNLSRLNALREAQSAP